MSWEIYKFSVLALYSLFLSLNYYLVILHPFLLTFIIDIVLYLFLRLSSLPKFIEIDSLFSSDILDLLILNSFFVSIFGLGIWFFELIVKSLRLTLLVRLRPLFLLFSSCCCSGPKQVVYSNNYYQLSFNLFSIKCIIWVTLLTS